MWLVEPEAEGELSGIRVPGWFDVFLGRGPYTLFGCRVGELTCDLQEHRCPGWIIQAGNRSVTQNTIEPRYCVPSCLRDFLLLRRKIPGGCDDADGSTTHVLIHDRIVVQVESNWVAIIPDHVVLSSIFPPVIERTVVFGGEDLVVEPQTETRTTESVGPDLGVLTVAAEVAVVPLIGKVSSHARVAPGERVVTVADHLKGMIPLGIP